MSSCRAPWSRPQHRSPRSVAGAWRWPAITATMRRSRRCCVGWPRSAGRLDILVNNAASIHDSLIDPGGFWEKPLALVEILDVGLRSAYVASYFAAPLMVAAKSGLHRLYLLVRIQLLHARPGLWRPEGRARQVRRRYGGRSSAARGRRRLAVARTAAHRAHRRRRSEPPGAVRRPSCARGRHRSSTGASSMRSRTIRS